MLYTTIQGIHEGMPPFEYMCFADGANSGYIQRSILIGIFSSTCIVYHTVTQCEQASTEGLPLCMDREQSSPISDKSKLQH